MESQEGLELLRHLPTGYEMDRQTVSVEESERDPIPGNHSYDDGGRMVWGTELLCLFQARPPD